MMDGRTDAGPLVSFGSVELTIGVTFFHMRYPYMEFQDPSFNGLKDTVK